ncbi:hypothetical protein BJX96DRAFT_58719 [Aspergillus floccosus]
MNSLFYFSIFVCPLIFSTISHCTSLTSRAEPRSCWTPSPTRVLPQTDSVIHIIGNAIHQPTSSVSLSICAHLFYVPHDGALLGMLLTRCGLSIRYRDAGTSQLPMCSLLNLFPSRTHPAAYPRANQGSTLDRSGWRINRRKKPLDCIVGA